jgi:hypothetical protein
MSVRSRRHRITVVIAVLKDDLRHAYANAWSFADVRRFDQFPTNRQYIHLPPNAPHIALPLLLHPQLLAGLLEDEAVAAAALDEQDLVGDAAGKLGDEDGFAGFKISAVAEVALGGGGGEQVQNEARALQERGLRRASIAAKWSLKRRRTKHGLVLQSIPICRIDYFFL